MASCGRRFLGGAPLRPFMFVGTVANGIVRATPRAVDSAIVALSTDSVTMGIVGDSIVCTMDYHYETHYPPFRARSSRLPSLTLASILYLGYFLP